MTTNQTYYVVMVMQKWDTIAVNYGPRKIADGNSPDGSAYYLSVYETREQAEAAHPGSLVVAVRPTPQDEEQHNV